MGANIRKLVATILVIAALTTIIIYIYPTIIPTPVEDQVIKTVINTTQKTGVMTAYVTPINYETNLTIKQFNYVLDGTIHTTSIEMYSGVMDEIASNPAPVACWRYTGDSSLCNDQETDQYYLAYLNEPVQDKELNQLISNIKKQSSDQNQQAKIAVRLVQNIPYNWNKFYASNFVVYYPYETLYNNQGVCEEKSLLLAYILSRLGFDTVLFDFKTGNHMAVGVKCDPQYAYQGTGYCFIESTTPIMITDSSLDYVGVGQLKATPTVYRISPGLTLSEINDEYNDAIKFNQIEAISKNNGNILNQQQYLEWQSLVTKYGIKLTSD